MQVSVTKQLSIQSFASTASFFQVHFNDATITPSSTKLIRLHNNKKKTKTISHHFQCASFPLQLVQHSNHQFSLQQFGAVRRHCQNYHQILDSTFDAANNVKQQNITLKNCMPNQEFVFVYVCWMYLSPLVSPPVSLTFVSTLGSFL